MFALLIYALAPARDVSWASFLTDLTLVGRAGFHQRL